MELDEFHVLHRDTSPQRHAATVAGAGVCRRAGEVGAAIAAGREDGSLRPEPVQRAIVHLQRHHAAASTVGIHDQVDGEVFDEELCRSAQRLLVKRVQHGMAGPVCRRTGALGLPALAVVGSHAAEGPLIDLAVFAPREWHAVVFEFDDRRHGFAGHVFDGVLIAQPVRALHGVVHVPAPVIFTHVTQRRGDPALRGNGMGPGRKDLGDVRSLQPGFGQAERRTQARAPGADDNHVKGMVSKLVFSGRH